MFSDGWSERASVEIASCRELEEVLEEATQKAKGTIRAKALNFHLRLFPSIFRRALQMYGLCLPFEDDNTDARLSDFPEI